MAEVDVTADIPIVFNVGANLVAAVDIVASIPIVFSVSAHTFPARKYTYTKGNVVITSTSVGAQIRVNGSNLGKNLTPNDLSTLATFLGTRLSPGNGLGPWTVTASSQNWLLRYNGTSTTVATTKEEWSAVAEALWLYLG